MPRDAELGDALSQAGEEVPVEVWLQMHLSLLWFKSLEAT